ncbi:polyprenyl synthetase family protein [Streptomyces durbertensis]|uniref:Polyprenyl synthetase family protein n=1 Tax=Streptomyces durbertensis TaxID=2448886 RepID=A0ABR6EIV3_9ACTN|nr:polyprenyl synthetase family protein [Streptomyces durbertensis]MBB1245272.1 polyprenyl synthetase family protein [Streptomyces durbertensis]
MTITLTEEPLAPTRLLRAVENELEAFLSGKRARAADGTTGEPAAALADFVLRGGKRVRPLMCLCGWAAARAGRPAPTPDAPPVEGARPTDQAPPEVVRAAASLELFHAFALIHDDVMDNSDTRRGAPSLHRLLASRSGRTTDAADERFGRCAALLLGDLAFSWADEALHTAGLPPRRLAAVLRIQDVMREELMAGQYLDLVAGRSAAADLGTALTATRLKTAAYTFQRPLQVGVALAGGDAALHEACGAYGLPLGEAFQLRDDLLGVFGDPAATGKPVGDDIREGRNTVLVALAVARADRTQRAVLSRTLGRPDIGEADIERVRRVLVDTGAREETERMITERLHKALDAVRGALFPDDVRDLLAAFADQAARRDR